MTTQRIHHLIFVLGVTTLLVQTIVLHRRGSTPPGASDPKQGESVGSADDGKPSDSPSQAQKATTGPDYVPLAPVQRWRVLTRSSVFQLIEPRSLELKEVVAELLGLTPEQTMELQGAFSTLLDEVRAEELRQAYVRVKGDGSEEVVVAPFDRGPLLRKFRENLATQVGSDAADFCAREALYDSTLALGSKEVRIYTLRGSTDGEKQMQVHPDFSRQLESMKDRERLMVSRGVHRKNPLKKPEQEGEAAPPLESTLSNTADYGPRYRHLQEAKSRLPRKSE